MARVIRAPRGTELTCKGWQQEAAMRMLMNNLDPEVAERPEDLIVYGGAGKAARNWECFDAIVDSLKKLEGDETLLVQSGKPVGVFCTPPRCSPGSDLQRDARAPLGHMGGLLGTGGPGPHHVWTDDRRKLDLHRYPGNTAGDL